MKNAKKLASIILAIVMVLAMAIPAFAAGETANGKITISNALVGKQYTIYKILDLESYDKAANAYSYKAATAWADFINSTDVKGVYVDVDDKGYVTWHKNDDGTDADQVAFAKLAQKYAKDNSIANQGSVEAAAAADAPEGTKETTVEFTGLALGYYLLDTNLGTLCSLDTTDNEVTITEKNAEPTNEKEVKEGEAWGKTNDATIGDTVEFQSTITAQAGAESYVFHDEMSAGLTYGSVASVKLGDKVLVNKADVTGDAAYDYEVKAPGTCGCTFEVVFTQAFCDTLKDNDKIVVSYTATLNASAVVGDAGNLNKSFIKYGEGSKFTTTPSETKTYTWKFDVFKYTLDKTDNTTKKPLAGAKFTLSTNANGSNPIEFVADASKNNGVVVGYRVAVAADTDKITEIETNADGKFSLNGLDSGTYYLTETAAPTGYNKLDKAVEVKIDNKGVVSVKNAEGAYEAVGADGVEVENNTGSELPETGGIGTTIFYVVGSLLLAGAAVLLIAKKRMSAER